MRPTSVGQRLIASIFPLLVLVLMAGTAAPFARAQKTSAPAPKEAPTATAKDALPAAASGLKYNPATEVTLKGTIDDMKELPDAAGEVHVQVLLKTGQGTSEVRLCPHAFLQELEMNLAKGDEIEVTGSKVKVDDKEIILGRTVVKGNNTLVLRDKHGNPVWTWLKK